MLSNSINACYLSNESSYIRFSYREVNIIFHCMTLLIQAHAFLTPNIIALLYDPLIKYKILHVIMVMSEIILNLDFPFYRDLQYLTAANIGAKMCPVHF